MTHAAPIQGWDIRYGIAPALVVGAVSALLALAAVLSQPPLYQAGIRILDTGGFSADEAEALAFAPETAAAAVSLPAVSGYNLLAKDFLRGSAVEGLLEGGTLRLTVRDSDPDLAENRALVWAQALCAALEERAAPADGCYESGALESGQTESYLIWKVLTAALLGSAIAYGSALLQARSRI